MRYLTEAKNYIITLLTLIAIAIWAVGWLSSPVGGSREPVLVVLPKGANASELGKCLKEKGLIRSRKVFVFTVRLSGKSANLKPGAYKLNRQTSLLQIIQKIERGDVAADWVTVPEGFTMRQIAGMLAAKGLMTEDAFIQASYEGALYPDLEVGSAGSLEGYLFPDTYFVSFQPDPRETVGAMVETFRKKIIEPYASEIQSCKLCKIVPDGRNLRNVVVVASLIEREAKMPQDRAKIAGVIYNRLQLGMKLDIDATVQYARGQHKSRLLYQDLDVDSPYNTYLHAGLPPGPIANPGEASIEAALHPAATDALYYVARKDGSHIFSRTLAEHNAAIRRVRSGN